jgi:hypothetical protein
MVDMPGAGQQQDGEYDETRSLSDLSRPHDGHPRYLLRALEIPMKYRRMDPDHTRANHAGIDESPGWS